MSKVRWLLVGAGDIARKRVAPALAAVSDSEIAAVCDARRDEAAALAEEFGSCECFSDFDQALSGSPADAVYIATPVWLHASQAVAALNAGRHVLVEKPLGLNAAGCAVVTKAARLSGRNAACVYFRRFYPRYAHLKQVLERGELGRVVSVRMTYYSWFDPTPDDPKYWRVIRSRSGGGPLSDMGTHMFDVLIGLFGMPTSVFAKCDTLAHDWEVEDSASVIMTLKDGAQVTGGFGWNSRTWRHEFEVVGTEAKINWLPYDSGSVVKTVGRNAENLDLPCAGNVHQPLVEDFVQSVVSGRPPKYSIAESAKANTLLDAIYQSAGEGREVRL